MSCNRSCWYKSRRATCFQRYQELIQLKFKVNLTIIIKIAIITATTITIITNIAITLTTTTDQAAGDTGGGWRMHRSVRVCRSVDVRVETHQNQTFQRAQSQDQVRAGDWWSGYARKYFCSVSM